MKSLITKDCTTSDPLYSLRVINNKISTLQFFRTLILFSYSITYMKNTPPKNTLLLYYSLHVQNPTYPLVSTAYKAVSLAVSYSRLRFPFIVLALRILDCPFEFCIHCHGTICKVIQLAKKSLQT